MTPKAKYYETLANTMIKNFEKRRMEAYYYPTAKEAVEKALSFLPSGAVVAHGGSMTLEETGMMDALRSADIEFLDRAVCKTPEDSRKILHRRFTIMVNQLLFHCMLFHEHQRHDN